mgnify:CR=1 FL=1
MSDDPLTAEIILARVHADGIRRACNAYRKPPIPSRLLQELAALPDEPLALEFVAAYPLSPSHLLETLATAEPPPSVLAQLATNPRTPPHLLTQLAAHADTSVRAQAALHPQLPSREIIALATDPQPEVRRALAGNSSLRLPHQAALVIDPDPAVRLALAGQPGLPPPVALVLGANASAAVRLHTIATCAAEEDLLQGWAASDEEDVQLALLQRRNLPAEVCHTLVRSTHAGVRRLARPELDLDDVDLFFLATRGEADERAWVATRSLVPRPLQSLLARDTEVAVQAALAANPVLDATIARFFVNLGEESVCAALASNPALPADLVEALAATRHPAVLAALAYRADIDADLAQFLLVHSPDFRRHWAFQNRTDLAIEPDTARELFGDALPTVRVLAITACPDWRRADLYDLARDPVPAVRIAALRHPQAPDELLIDASADPTEEVAVVAREVQQARPRQPRVVTAPKTKTARVHADVDAAPPRPTLSDPPVAPSATTPAPRSAAPKFLNKLKRILWQ